MAYRLKHSEAVASEIERLVVEQINRAVAEIDDAGLDADTTIHQVRKRCKKVRAVLRLARGSLDRDGIYELENAFFRDLAAELSDLRDAGVLIETHDELAGDIENPDVLIECAAVRGRLTTRRLETAASATGIEERLQAARARLLEGRARVPGWARRVRGFQRLERGLRRTYRQGRRAMHASYQSLADEDFHEWRKRVKYHWYACRLLQEIWPAVMKARRKETARLGKLLGHEHDLGVYRALLDAETTWFGANTRLQDILAAVDLRRTGLRREARPLGMRLYAEKPDRFSARCAAYWRAWRAESD